MAEGKETADKGHPAANDPIPRGQEIFDHTWLWLALGIAVPTLFYIVWGLVDLLLL